MAAPLAAQPRVRVDGKFFRLGETKFHPKGVAYGPFAPGTPHPGFPAEDQVRRDFTQMRALGANLVRVYQVPPRWVLDLAAEQELKLLVDIPWNKHLCFLDLPNEQAAARSAVRNAARLCAGHPAVFALSVVNEIPADIVRWSGARPVADFIDELAAEAKAVDADCLCTFANFPPTEFLRPQNLDFLCFNVYLHQRRPFENYLARLQMIAEARPLVLGELGADSLREGEPAKSQMLAWQIESAFRAGLAGAVVFSFTDDWHRGGQAVTDWAFGLTTRERQPKESFFAVQRAFQSAPYFPLSRAPKISVVVASYNGDRTLRACLDSLSRLNYPDYEVILVDDGSTDTTPQISQIYKSVRYFRQTNQGLSVARNTGIAIAAGEIVAFTDSDCRADEDWLYYLAGDLLNSEFVGLGGHNFLPPEDSPAAAAVMASPGGPAPVMLTDRLAEHIPGCNMAFYKWALEEIGGFDPIYRKAGDDVDVCWRLQQRGYQIGFSPAGFVWHHRRPTLQSYLKQQQGYGEAEALLVRKHPEYFNALGGSLWAGRIYATAQLGLVTRRPIIYHGLFGSGLFQTLYAGKPAVPLMLLTSFEYHVLITLPLWVLSVPFRFLFPVALTSLLISVGICLAAAWQAVLPRNKMRLWSRPLVALLFFLQPLVRGWARYHGRLTYQPTPLEAHEKLDSLALRDSGESLAEVLFWADHWVDRLEFVRHILARLEEEGWHCRADTGWNNFDVEVFGTRWTTLHLTTATELYAEGKQLFRCRLKTFWSLAAKAGLGALLALELLLIGFLGRSNEWLWMLLLSLPLLGWLVAQQERSLQSLIAVFLDDLAQAHGMIKVKMPEDGKSSIPKPVADRPVRRPQRDPDRPSPAPKSANGPLRVVLPKTTPAKVPNSPPSNDQGAAP